MRFIYLRRQFLASVRSSLEWRATRCGLLLLIAAPAALADEQLLQFNPNFMRIAPGQSTDASASALRSLAAQTSLAPGRYQVEVLVNLAAAGRREIDFRERTDGKGLEPCLSAALLRELGLREEALAASSSGCLNWAASTLPMKIRLTI